MTVPSWLAARCGLPGDSSATNDASQVAQFLDTHGITVVYAGTQIVTPEGNVSAASGYTGLSWANLFDHDIDQPFAMPSGDTAAGRVTLPLAPSGNGADVTVSLCADSSGTPGTVITSVRVPAAWLAQLAAPAGTTAGPLATAQSNTLRLGAFANYSWSAAASAGVDGPVFPAIAISGDWLIMAGGVSPSGGTAVTAVTAASYSGGTVLATPVQQPSLPQATAGGALMATPDTLVFAGGDDGSGTYTPYTNVWAASFDPSSGSMSSWSAQQALPAALTTDGSCASWGQNIYLVTGYDASANVTGTVYWATVSNGQVTAWNTGPSLPVPTVQVQAAAVEGWLIAAGGFISAGASLTQVTTTWYSKLASDGTPGPWTAGPDLPLGASSIGTPAAYASPGGMIVPCSAGIQTLAVTADGPGPSWQSVTPNPFGAYAAAAFPVAGGQWQVFTTYPLYYSTASLTPVPAVSVPLPATGLTAGGTYHLLLHQEGGTADSYVQVALDPAALPSAALYRPASGGSWSTEADGYALIAAVYDQAAGGPVLHTWEDSGARVTSLAYAGASGQLTGICEATVLADGTVLPAVTEVTYDSNGLPTGLVQLA